MIQSCHSKAKGQSHPRSSSLCCVMMDRLWAQATGVGQAPLCLSTEVVTACSTF